MGKNRLIAQGAILAAMYVVISHFQNILLPGSGSLAVQLRLSEALCVLALFTPAAAPGLALGCLVFNLSFSSALPLDFLVGSGATYIACVAMHRLKKRWYLALSLPAVCSGVLVGWELTVYMGGGFFLNAGAVALGELAALYLVGAPLYLTLRRRKLDSRLFPSDK